LGGMKSGPGPAGPPKGQKLREFVNNLQTKGVWGGAGGASREIGRWGP